VIGGRSVKIKIFSVEADTDFRALWIGEETRKLSANEYLEREVQRFLHENPDIEVKHPQYSSTQIIPKTAAWGTTNVDIDWIIEKTLILLYQEKG
jgi:hypothetical protein